MRTILALSLALLVSPAAGQSLALPWAADVQGTGTPGLSNAPLFLWRDLREFDPTPTLRIDRHVNGGSGQSWNTYKALWVLGSTNASNAGFEWTITGEQHNTALASTGAQNVAVNGTIFKEANGIGPVGPSWGGNFNCTDTTGEVDPVASCIGAEIDVGAKAGAGTDKNRQRVGVQIVGGGASDVHTGYGILMGTNGGTFDRGIALAGPYGLGIDLTAASFSGAAISLAPEQWLAFDGTAAGGFGHFLGLHDGRLTYMSPGGPLWRVSDDGAVYLGRVVEQIPHVPTSATSPCETGERAWDQAYEYRCVSPNRWKRAALSDW